MNLREMFDKRESKKLGNRQKKDKTSKKGRGGVSLLFKGKKKEMYNNWEELEESIENCNKCKLCKARINIVFGVGNKNADIMLIGEGPGADEDKQGIPFVGKAGQLMNKAFEGLGIERESLYIANVVKCRPPANRVPEEDEAEVCLNYLRNQVILVKPKIIVLLGSTALKNILRKRIWNYIFQRKMGRKKRNIIYANMASCSAFKR